MIDSVIPRERVQKAINHQIPDRVPIDLGGFQTGIHKKAYKDLIEIGVDILNPVQTSANNMDPKALKEKYGDQIVFWGGGIDSQHILPFADPDQVRDEVRKNLDIFKPRGGYVFNNIHNIQAGISPENIVALYDAAYDFGSYE
ncbi:MAG: uroporphyrinogen decarboxylase family protein [Bacteroidota bacterium]